MHNAHKNRILVIGDVMLDEYVYGSANRLSPESPCAVLCDCISSKISLGGAANVAFQLSQSDYNVSIWSCIGTDRTGADVLKLLADNDIQSLLFQKDGIVTTRKTRYITKTNHQLLRVDKDSQYIPIPDDYAPLLLMIERGDFAAVVLSDYDKGILSEELCISVIRACKSSKTKSIVDIKHNSIQKFRGASVIKGNKKEFDNLLQNLGISQEPYNSEANLLEQICRQFESQCAIMTKGRNGIVGYSISEGFFHFNSNDVPIYDVTGAGDVVTAFVTMLLLQAQYSFKEILNLSNMAAMKKVTQAGTGLVRLSDVLRHSSKQAFVSDICAIRAAKTVVFTNGCFDILHAGHVVLLEKAKSYGDILVVGLNSDASVRRIKGEKRPINTYKDRAFVLAALECVDYVIQFEEDTPYNLITQLKPNVLVKGGDYSLETIVGADFVKSYGGSVKIVPLYGNLSTTNILNSMCNE